MKSLFHSLNLMHGIVTNNKNSNSIKQSLEHKQVIYHRKHLKCINHDNYHVNWCNGRKLFDDFNTVCPRSLSHFI